MNYNKVCPDRHKVEAVKILLKSLRKAWPVTCGYQPVPFKEFADLPCDEEREKRCTDRLKMILATLSLNIDGLKVLDIGCNLGYFSFEFAKRGAKVTGIEERPDLVAIARKINELYGLDIEFMSAVFSSSLISRLNQKYDVVLYLSLHHHIIKTQGLEESRKILDGISQISRVMFFDMGQTNEGEGSFVDWVDKIPDMGDKPDEWIKQEILRYSRFNSVVVCGTTKSHGVDRYLFRCERAERGLENGRH